MEDEWEKLVQYNNNNNNCICEKIESKNDIEKYNISSFPTIRFYPKGKKDNHIEYKGDRTFESFKHFLNNNLNIQNAGG